jgi:hypothetical protein
MRVPARTAEIETATAVRHALPLPFCCERMKGGMSSSSETQRFDAVGWRSRVELPHKSARCGDKSRAFFAFRTL